MTRRALIASICALSLGWFMVWNHKYGGSAVPKHSKYDEARIALLLKAGRFLGKKASFETFDQQLSALYKDLQHEMIQLGIQNLDDYEILKSQNILIRERIDSDVTQLPGNLKGKTMAVSDNLQVIYVKSSGTSQ